MKLFTLLLFSIFFSSLQSTFAQSGVILPDQNPQYSISKEKYMGLADSINKFHSTTLQNTYEAYDWYDAKQKRRSDRLLFRRELRLERARYSNRWNYNNYNGWNNRNYYQPYNNWQNGNYRNNNRRSLPYYLFPNWYW
ncbi:MAG TPA: hypothetical protein VLR49_11015 [Ferruginibacter sp.]|nr:hypothetical protein [Ferruginibacter sp.]